MLFEFPLTSSGKNFQFIVFTSTHFYSRLSSPLKTPGRIFWKSVFPKTKGVEKIMIYFIKIQSENKKMTWNIRLFKNSVVLSLLLLLCNHGNLTLKLHQKNIYLNKGWLFTARLKVRSLPRMIKKEALTQFTYKNLPNQPKNCLPWRHRKFITLAMYVKKKEWVKAKNFWLIANILKLLG